ncbi:hypothetical protein HK104_004321 [Borealophlyctis nickersoniae]|nr:hypothetical protein HK104_004321 [Borealophlyctis nickersoniae]
MVSFKWGSVEDDSFMQQLVEPSQPRNGSDAVHGGGFDIIVSNPPYIPPHEYAELDEGVSLWEDRRALLASDSDGVRFHKRIGRLAKAFLLRNEGDRIGGISEGSTPPVPTLVLEVGEGQAQKVVQVLRDEGFTQVEAWKDLVGVERTVVTYASPGEAGGDDEVS